MSIVMSNEMIQFNVPIPVLSGEEERGGSGRGETGDSPRRGKDGRRSDLFQVIQWLGHLYQRMLTC